MSKRKSDQFLEAAAKRTRDDTYEALGFSGSEGTAESTAGDISTVAGGTGVGGGGDMPRTSLNNAYSGHAIVAIPDVLAAPVELTYAGVFSTIRLQHPMINLIATGQAFASPTSFMLTVTKVEMFGASAGIISMTPHIQSTPVNDGGGNIQWIGQQMLDVGTLNSKPHLSHTFGDSIMSTRIVNSLVATGNDRLVSYQYVQRAASPVPIDAGYLRISFICRMNTLVDLTAAFPVPPLLKLGLTTEELKDMIEQQVRTTCKKTTIGHIKALAMPTLDK